MPRWTSSRRSRSRRERGSVAAMAAAPQDRARVVRDLIAGDPWRMEVLRAVRELGLPDWAIGAGFVRTRVWDWLAGDRARTPLGDIDVLYHDPADLAKATEAALERRLASRLPAPWSVKNQARMHLRNGDPAYGSTENALRFWLETPTCVAVRLGADNRLELLAPHGLDDLFAMIVRPTPRGRECIEAYRRRLATKGWQAVWPGLRIIDE